MLCKLTLQIKPNSKDFGYYQSSNLQGLLMEYIEPTYATFLHESVLNPYSQFLETNNGNYYWHINTLNRAAYDNIIRPLLFPEVTYFKLKKNNIDLQILDKHVSTIEPNDFIKKYYEEEIGERVNVNFITPCAFKSDGNYQIFPDFRFIYRSIMNKFSCSDIEFNMFDNTTLEDLANNSYITKYNLRTLIFPVEKVKIPGFVGNISVRYKGSDSLFRYVNLLFNFAEYSGIGVKASIGMGGIKVWRNKNE